MRNSDLGYAINAGALTLNRLLSGSIDSSIDAKAGNLVKQLTAENGELTIQNFGSAIRGLRQAYAKAGIKSKADGYQLSNQGYAEKRFNEADLLGMQRALDMTFDANGFQVAKQLAAGKERGLKLAKLKRLGRGVKTSAPDRATAQAQNRLKFAKVH